MPPNLGTFFVRALPHFFIKIGYGAKNTVDRVVDLCYNRTIERQERQGTERQEKWRAKK